MSLWSKQLYFCNGCGRPAEAELPRVIGRRWKVCSMECHEEMEWRETLSIMGKPYYRKPPPDAPVA